MMDISNNYQDIYNAFRDRDGEPCVYMLYQGGFCVYIGKSVSVFNRIIWHADKDFDKIKALFLNNAADMDILELYLINTYKPELNKDCVRSSFPSFKIDYHRFMKSKVTLGLNNRELLKNSNIKAISTSSLPNAY